MTLNELELESHKILFNSNSFTKLSSNSFIVNSNRITVQLNEEPLDFYRHGWQSWSLTTWHSPNFALPEQKPIILHPMQTDPAYVQWGTPNGSAVSAVQFSDENILLLGAVGLDAHVELKNNQLIGTAEAELVKWFICVGEERSVFSEYANLLGEKFGLIERKPNLNVWCSWYSFYVAISESLLYKVFDEFADSPFDVLQVDDGWQIAVGDWDVNEKFPSGMKALANKIKSSGRRAGLWLAPFIAVKSSKLFAEFPGWFLKDDDGFVSAGFNWGEKLYALDTTVPEVLEFLSQLMKKVLEWGFDYIKLDFLYAGALPGNRANRIGREMAYRNGLAVIRKALGEAYFLTCGAPIIPSLGLCDAMRIGPDVAAEWENFRDANVFYNPTTPGAKNAIRTTISRLWLQPLVACDPDVVYFREKNNSLKEEEMRLLQDLAYVCQFKATSDVPSWLKENERNKLNEFLRYSPKIERISRYKFKIDQRIADFSMAMSMPLVPTGINSIKRYFVGSAANSPFILTIFDRLFKMESENQVKDI
jgi:alpha-galactosidase